MNAKKLVDVRVLIGQRLKKAREEINLSQRKLGLLTGLSDKTISAYEKARVLPPLEVLIKIAKQLGKPVSYFLGEDNPIERLTSRIIQLNKQIKRLKKELNSIEIQFKNCEQLIEENKSS